MDSTDVLGGCAVGIGVVVMIVLLSLLMAIPVFYLWNWLVPVIFGLKAISLVQAWGLLVLSGFLFKSTSTPTTSK